MGVVDAVTVCSCFDYRQIIIISSLRDINELIVPGWEDRTSVLGYVRASNQDRNRQVQERVRSEYSSDRR